MTEEQEKLVLENQKLIGLVINRKHLKFKFNELVDVGMIGLLKGTKRFDETKGFKASTYLYSCIQSEIYHYLKFNNAQKRGRDYQTISLDQELNIKDNNVYLSDFIADEKVDIEKEIERNELINLVYKKINNLNERDKAIICHNFGILGFEKMKQKEIAKSSGISQTQVSRIIYYRLKKIKEELKDYA